MSEQHDERELEGAAAEPPATSDEPTQVDEPTTASADDELEQQLADELGDDAGAEPQPGDDEQPPAGEQVSDKEIEQTFERLDRETARHVKRVAELVGEGMFAYLKPCPLCHPAAPGFIWPGPIADEAKAEVRLAIGDRQPENWQADQYSRKCDACEGLGEVITGSQVRGQQTLPCLTCEARGWVPIGDERRAGGARIVTLQPRPDVEQPQPSVPANEPPEVAAARAAGYIVIKPGAVE